MEVSWGVLDGLMAGSLYYISILGMSWVGVSSPTHDLAMEVGVLVFIAYRRYLRSATVRVPLSEADHPEYGAALMDCMWCQNAIYMRQERSAIAGKLRPELGDNSHWI